MDTQTAVIMKCSKLLCLIFVLVCLVPARASYECGIAKHSLVQMITHGWTVEAGQWPWHVAIFHKSTNETKYVCGGTLIDRIHIVTAAHCIVNCETNNSMPLEDIQLHFGQTDLSKMEKHSQVRDVGRIHVHPEYFMRRYDIAVLELGSPIDFTDFVIPICLEAYAHKDSRDLHGQRGWITGWGMTQNGTVSNELQSASLPVVDNVHCMRDYLADRRVLMGRNMLCAGDRNGTSPGTGDSGGGMYFNEGNRWVLRGIVSFARVDSTSLGVQTSKHVVFVNVQHFVTWIREVTDDRNSKAKRISEIECDRFRNFAKKRSDGSCFNAGHSSTVSLVDDNAKHQCSGALVNDNHVLSTCGCAINAAHVRAFGYGLNKITNRICTHFSTLAIIELTTPFALSQNIIPACLANHRTENLYGTLTVKGFHRQRYMTGRARLFEWDKIIVNTMNECLRFYPELDNYFSQTDSLKLCVINNETEPLISMDFYELSGSSLQYSNPATCLSTVVGQFSNVIGHTQYMFGFYRVALLLDWIENVIWGTPVVSESTTSVLEKSTVSKRISEKECDRFKSFARKRNDGRCMNHMHPQTISIIHSKSGNVCTGILLNEDHVLTTCSCLRSNKTLHARFDGHQTVKIESSICHPAYNFNTDQQNIAIAKLISPVQLSYNRIPACLSINSAQFLNDTLLVTSFTRKQGSGIEFFKTNYNQLITTDECNRNAEIMRRNESIVPTQLCVLSNDTEPVSRYRGSMLQAVDKSSCLSTVVGIFNFGVTGEVNQTATDCKLLVFSRIAQYLDWIEETVWGAEAVAEATTNSTAPGYKNFS